jgi:hypothetical protein
MNLKMDLGPWLHHDLYSYHWYFSPTSDSLIQITTDKQILLHPRYNRRTYNTFCAEGTPMNQPPTTLLKASVQLTKDNLLWMTDKGYFSEIAQEPTYKTFSDYLQRSERSNRWCFNYVDIPQDYELLLSDMMEGHVILISDGSYNPTDNYGTAAWILEGKLSNLQMSGKIITPGQATVQSAYRSELAGILAAVSIINELAKFHSVNTSITLLCDCEKGLEKAFSKNSLALQDSSYDLLQAIHYKLEHSSIQWTGAHIKGHQDDGTPFKLLDRPSQLNVLVDQMAKGFLKLAASLPRHYEVWSNSWFL